MGLGFRCALSADGTGRDVVRYDFMHALISMGKEQWNDALKSIDRAIKRDPANVEYRQTQSLILKQMNM